MNDRDHLAADSRRAAAQPPAVLRRFLLLVAVGLLVRLLFVVTSIGTTDVIFMTMWGDLASRFGVSGAYARHPLLNHPPLSLLLLRGLWELARVSGIEFTDLIRLAQIAADVGSLFCLAAIGRRLGVGERWPALFFFLSPVAIFVSGFHCNTDPTMVFLLLLGVLLSMRRNHFAAGAAVGLAAGIKILPLLAIPLFVLAARRGWRRTSAGFALTAGAIFVPAVLIGGPAVLRNIFLYRSVGNWWGPVSMLEGLRRALPPAADGALRRAMAVYGEMNAIVIFAALLALTGVFWRGLSLQPDDEAGDTGRLLAALGALYAGAIVLGAGFGVQYLAWVIPFLPFALARNRALTVNGLLSFFLFFVYTVWAGRIPWHFADANAPEADSDALVIVGWLAWSALVVVVIAAVRRVAAEPRAARSTEARPSG